MERLPVLRRTPALAAALALSTNLTTADAAVLARFDFEDANGAFTTAADELTPNFGTGLWHDADGTFKSVTNAAGFALSASSFDDGNQFLLTLTPPEGFDLQLSAIDFEQRASASGPLNWQLKLAGNPFAIGTTATTLRPEHVLLTTPQFNIPLELALFADGAKSSLGTWRIDNFAVHGTLQPTIAAVPIPVLGWLFGGAALSLLRQRRGVAPRV